MKPLGSSIALWKRHLPRARKLRRAVPAVSSMSPTISRVNSRAMAQRQERPVRSSPTGLFTTWAKHEYHGAGMQKAFSGFGAQVFQLSLTFVDPFLAFFTRLARRPLEEDRVIK